MSSLVLFLLLGVDPVRINLPEDLVGVSDMVSHNGFIFLIDSRNATLFKCNGSGEELARVGRRGNGPGEFQRPVALAASGQMLVVCDDVARTLTVFDQNLNYQVRHLSPYMPRDLAISKDSFYLVSHNPQTNTMVQKYSHEMVWEKGFALGLQPVDKMVSFQTGKVLLHGDLLYFMHTFRSVLEVFDPSGNLVKTISIPGLEDPLFGTLKPRPDDSSWYKEVGQRAVGGVCTTGNTIHLLYLDTAQSGPNRYSFDLQTNLWSMAENTPRVYALKDQLVILNRTENDRLVFKTFDSSEK